MPRLFIDQALMIGEEIIFDADSTHRIDKVLRLKTGDGVSLFNGQGGEYSAALTAVSRKTAVAKIESFDPIDRESKLNISLIQGISRGARMDYTIQKAVELGVKKIYPVETKRSMVQLDERRKTRRQAHWQSVIKHAAEQSGRTQLATLLPVTALDSIEATVDAKSAFFLDTQTNSPLSREAPQTDEIWIIAGPEGGFDQQERNWIREIGAHPIRLGPRTLRTETAALSALSIMQAWWGDLL